MTSEAPPFWWEPRDWRSTALWPAARVVGAVAARRMRRAPRVPVAAPVLCVGNFTVGGTGKTPAVIAFARHAKAKGLKPGVLSRGHGGSFGAPHLVRSEHDSAKHTGDEPLLLARHAPVAVTPNREAGARLLIEQGCDFLIMDDGFQSARIAIDFALAVVDSHHGLGNGQVIPAGPLRAPLVEQLRHADALLRMGDGHAADDVVRAAARAGRPTFHAMVAPVDAGAVKGKRFLAFAGIGHPERFFLSAEAAGAKLALTRTFGDHHPYQPQELAELDLIARDADLRLLTTAKDAVRFQHMTLSAEFRARLNVFEIETQFETQAVPERIVTETLRAWDKRRLAS